MEGGISGFKVVMVGGLAALSERELLEFPSNMLNMSLWSSSLRIPVQEVPQYANHMVT